jgi:hypothetical protein
MTAAIIAVLTQSDATVRKMKYGAFEGAKCFADPNVLARIVGDGLGTFIPVLRNYKPIGCTDAFPDYADARFDHLRIPDTPGVRAVAASINENGLKFPEGVRVPILEILANEDSRDTYRQRIRALIEVLR